MRKVSLLLFPMLAIALLMAFASVPAAAQAVTSTGDNSVYFVSYFSNNVAAAPDATVRFINDGDTGGNLWAAFYVFDDSQELTECCACEITPDGLLSEDVKTQLTANPLTGKVPTRGVIKAISSCVSGPDQRYSDGRTPWIRDAHPNGQSRDVRRYRNNLRRFESGGERASAVAEPLLL